MAWELIGTIGSGQSTALEHNFDVKRFRYKFTNENIPVSIFWLNGQSYYSYFSMESHSQIIIDKSNYSNFSPPLNGTMRLRTSGGTNQVAWVYRELVNVEPSISLNTVDDGVLYENDTLDVSGTVNDPDSGNTVTVKYSINNGPTRTLHTFVSDGSAVSFNKPLTFKRDKLHDGSMAVTGDLQEGVTHTLRVWAEDDQGGKSTVHSRTFNVIPNRPEVKVNGQSRVVETISCKVNGQAREVVKMWVKVNGELREV